MIGYCPDCKREWEALGEAHCANGCCRHFTSDSAFDRHLVKDECVDPAELRTKDGDPILELTERASGPAWKRAGEPDPRFVSALTGEQNPALTGSKVGRAS